MEMLVRLTLFAIGVWTVCVNSQLTIFNNTLCPGIVYIRTPVTSGKSWSEAQQLCRNISSTLPIIDTPDKQSCFAKSLAYFYSLLTPASDYRYVWIGANSSGGGSGQWRWLNGNSYSVPAIQDDNSYKRSYAFAVKESNSAFRLISSIPTYERFYICRYETTGNSNCSNQTNQVAFVRDGSCFVRYNETLSWFSARNRCLSKDGDLATFSDVSLLSEIIPQSGSWWIGLRSSRWTWQNAMSMETTDVTFTQWNDGQPDGDDPQCISTDNPGSTEYAGWRDWNCANPVPFICQLTSSLPSASSLSPQLTSLSSGKTAALTTTNPSPDRVSPDDKETAPRSGKQSEKGGSSNVMALGVGIGVGVGVPVLIALIALIVFLARRHRKRRTNSKEPRSGSSPDVTKSSSSESPYGVVAMGTAASNDSASEDSGAMASKTPIEYARLDILLPNSSSPNHFDSGDSNNIVNSNNSSQTPPAAETAEYAVVNRTRV